MDSLVGKYQETAAMGGNFFGLSILQHQKQIGQLIKSVRAQTLLDFGCGRGDPYRSPHKIHHTWGLKRANVTLYDPAFRPSSKPPGGRYDVVVCSDVLEHIPEEEVDAFIDRLLGYARHGVWASVCCRPAKKCFPGTEINMHVTIQPYEWWLERFGAAMARRDALPLDLVLVETP